MLFLYIGNGANNASKQKEVHCDKTTLKFFFFHFYNSEYLCFINIPCKNSVKKYPVVLEKKLILLFLLFLVTAAILDIRPDPILQF